MSDVNPQEPLTLSMPMTLTYNWAAGQFLQRFLNGLRDGKIYANQCNKCHRMLLPPKIVCGRCKIPMGDFVELSNQGTLISYMIVVDPMYDSATGAMREGIPYATCAVVLDGSNDTHIFHKLNELNPEKIRVGMRVEAVFKPREQREGSIFDIRHFRAIDE